METTKTKNLWIASIIGLATFLMTDNALAQSGVSRTGLQRHDLGIPGWETVQARIDFEPGAAFGKHTHPGEEVIYVLEGTLEYEVEGQPVTLKAGDVLFIPAGTVHAARNNGKVTGAELATYIVEKGKPVLVLKK